MVIVNAARVVIIFHSVLDRLFALKEVARSGIIARHLLLGRPRLYHYCVPGDRITALLPRAIPLPSETL